VTDESESHRRRLAKKNRSLKKAIYGPEKRPTTGAARMSNARPRRPLSFASRQPGANKRQKASAASNEKEYSFSATPDRILERYFRSKNY